MVFNYTPMARLLNSCSKWSFMGTFLDNAYFLLIVIRFRRRNSFFAFFIIFSPQRHEKERREMALCPLLVGLLYSHTHGDKKKCTAEVSPPTFQTSFEAGRRSWDWIYEKKLLLSVRQSAVCCLKADHVTRS